jgi:hypothetical protein
MASSSSSSSSSSSPSVYIKRQQQQQQQQQQINSCRNYRIRINPYSFRLIKSTYVETIWRNAIEKHILKDCTAIKRVKNNNNNNNSNSNTNSEACIAKESRNTSGLTFENLIRSLHQLLLSDDDDDSNSNCNSNSGSDGVAFVGKVIRHGGRDPYTEFFCLRDIAIPVNHLEQNKMIVLVSRCQMQ